METKTKEKPSETHTSNGLSDVEKSLFLSHSKDENSVLTQLLGVNRGDLDKIRQIRDFQMKDKHTFSSDNASKRYRNASEYRRMQHYVKSVGQYKKERQRRKEAVRLATHEHLGYREIAQQLGVSEKTVQRDLKKLQRYHMGQLNRRMWQWREEQDRELRTKMAGMTDIQKYEFLTKEIIRRDSLLKSREYHRHYQIIHLDLTQTDKYGIPKLTFNPSGGQTLAYPYKVRVHVKGRFEDKIFEADIGGFDIVQTYGILKP